MRYENDRSPWSSYMQPPFITVLVALLVIVAFLVVYVMRVERRFSQNTAVTTDIKTQLGSLAERADSFATKEEVTAVMQQLSETAKQSEIPVGGITVFYGLEGDLPGNWKICNGQTVNDPNSPRFDGRALPDLRNLFVRGAVSDLSVGLAEGVDTVRVRRSSARPTDGRNEVWGAADNTSLADNRPRHMALHYIIRIR